MKNILLVLTLSVNPLTMAQISMGMGGPPPIHRGHEIPISSIDPVYFPVFDPVKLTGDHLGTYHVTYKIDNTRSVDVNGNGCDWYEEVQGYNDRCWAAKEYATPTFSANRDCTVCGWGEHSGGYTWKMRCTDNWGRNSRRLTCN